MRLILYGSKADRAELVRTASVISELCYRNIRIDDMPDYDSFIAALGQSPPDGIVITVNGADGMEGVIAACNICANVPILWFSDDGAFGTQSYRLGCTYFHKKPITPDVLSAAMAKCMQGEKR